MTAIQRTQRNQQDRFHQERTDKTSRQAPLCAKTKSENAAAPKIASAESASVSQAKNQASTATQDLLETVQTALRTAKQAVRLLNRLIKAFNQKSSAKTVAAGSTRSQSAAPIYKNASTSNRSSTTVTDNKLTNGFLWKPASDKDGKLAILLPPSLTGTVRSVSITSPTLGEALETGIFAGTGNGDREHFRFGKSGGQYPDGSVVTVTFKDGSKAELPIKDTASRIER